MTTIASFRPSVSQMSEDVLLETIRNIRALRRMLPERPVRKTKTKKKPTAVKKTAINNYVQNLNEVGKQEMLQKLLRLKGG